MRSFPVQGEKTVIFGGRVVDGTGNPWVYGDVVLAGDSIAAVLPPGAAPLGPGAVDASGMIVCPGFIDIQSHSIMPFMADRRSLSKVTQGVTTEIMGEAWTPSPFGGRIDDPFRDTFPLMASDRERWLALGKSWTRFGDWLRWLEREGVSVNVGSFVGDGTVREWGKGLAMGPADAGEMRAMEDMLARTMEDGAFGLATALIYPPGCYASDEELVQLCRVVARYNGVHITHMRSEESRVLTALAQTLEIARRSGVATEIYHLKVAGRPNWRLMPEVIETITAARAAGIDVTADMYPYVAAGTGLASCLPPWAEEDGNLWRNVANEATRARIRQEMIEPDESFENLGANAGPENVILAGLRLPEHLPLRGKSLAHAANVRGQHWADTALDLLAAEQQNVFCFYFDMSDDNLQLQMQQPWIKFSTDAGGVDPEKIQAGLLHPRGFGTYPRVLGHYVRDLGTIPLEDAIRKMSSSVADRLSLRDRGLLRAGMKADVVIFDPETVKDNATFEAPHQLSTGVRDVWVNGVRVLNDGVHTGAFPGAGVKGPGYRPA
ncbi:MAG: D-aminoacylase [Thermomicrobiales bacterium]|nr:D-aminoacylase [Thermomicrobiales bacterium]